ncbi:kinase-like domain-containing protein [Rhizophagus clarus]|uniref:Kinase-like domain-containing protein n=1 Tax=Rhizophagus clarus TaxID=94130 RepID=A0A8H3QGD3_9GLOM|nr:kinase-like domain-containing protein [Rhizophagus clarus]
MEVNTEMVRHIIRTVHCYVLGTVISFAGDGDYRPAIREALELDHRNMVLIDWILNMPYGNVWRYRQNENTLKLYVITYSQWKEMKNLIRKYPEAEEVNNIDLLIIPQTISVIFDIAYIIIPIVKSNGLLMDGYTLSIKILLASVVGKSITVVLKTFEIFPTTIGFAGTSSVYAGKWKNTSTIYAIEKFVDNKEVYLTNMGNDHKYIIQFYELMKLHDDRRPYMGDLHPNILIHQNTIKGSDCCNTEILGVIPYMDPKTFDQATSHKRITCTKHKY